MKVFKYNKNNSTYIAFKINEDKVVQFCFSFEKEDFNFRPIFEKIGEKSFGFHWFGLYFVKFTQTRI